jgi:hypothetical protein
MKTPSTRVITVNGKKDALDISNLGVLNTLSPTRGGLLVLGATPPVVIIEVACFQR